jgi:MFS family permease
MAVNYVGTGMFVPFLLIYLHNVRGFGLETAGLVSAAYAGVGMVIGLGAGPAVDRVGARPTAAVSLVLLAVGLGAMPLVRQPWQAFAFVGVAGVGRGLFWPGYSTLLIAVTPATARAGSYAVQRVTSSLGFGLGGLAAGLIVSTADPSTFTLIFVLNAASYLLFLVALAFVTEPERAERSGEASSIGGYGLVLRDRAFIGAIVIGGVFAAFGVAQLNAMLPVYATSDAGVSARGIGLIFLFNTLAILVLQLPVAKLLQGRRRVAALALTGLVWAAAWLLALAAGLWFGVLAATALLIAVGVVFAVGECLVGVVQGPLVADLAPERLRGRYTALWLTANQFGFTLGPAVGGLLLARSPTLLWLVSAGVCVACSVAALLLGPVLPIDARRTPIPVAKVAA